MKFCFYPKHEYACPNVSHCPHLGGAALGTLVLAASDHDDHFKMVYGQLDFERERNTRLVDENEKLRKELDQVRLELKLERQNKFTCGREDKDKPQDHDAAQTGTNPDTKSGRKRGAPVGHPGWFRATPTAFDQLVLIPPPRLCPHCAGKVRTYENADPYDHFQEDIVDHVHQTTCFRHAVGRCLGCRRFVRQAGPGEILGSRIGPRMRALAIYLRNDIGISYRKVPQALEEMFGFSFVPASLIAFEKVLAELAAPLSDDIAKKIGASQGRGTCRRDLLDAQRPARLLLVACHNAVHSLPIRLVACGRGFAERAGRRLHRHFGHRLLFGLPRSFGWSEAEMSGTRGTSGS